MALGATTTISDSIMAGTVLAACRVLRAGVLAATCGWASEITSGALSF
jgi:hypothetical protein